MNSLTGHSLGFLVVEDDTVAAIELECILEDLGHRVTAVAVSPAAALARLEDAVQDIDAVIFGAMLVRLPPYALARELAARGIPAAISSQYPEPFVRVLGFDLPYLAKPYTRGDVAAVLRRMNMPEVAPEAA